MIVEKFAYPALMAIIAMIFWLTIKKEVSRLDSLLSKYEHAIKNEHSQESLDDLYKKIEKQKTNIIVGRFAIFASVLMSLFGLFTSLK